MKKILIVSAMVILFSTSVQADPFLGCAPVAAGTWDKIEMVMDGGAPVLLDPVPVSATDTRIRLYYDLVALPTGNHNVVLRPKKGVWYGAATPFAFAKPVVDPIINIGLTE